MNNEIRKGNEFQDKILAFVRISKSQYNNDVASGRLYMNKQSRFIEKENLTTGQADNKESLVVEGETDFVLKFGVLNKQYSLPITKMRHNLDVYIFCAYEIRLSEISYDKNNDCYVHVIPWEYISSFVDDTGEAEMLIISTPEIFVKKFDDAASKAGLDHVMGSVEYDLDEKINTPEYFEQVMEDGIASVFHKVKQHEQEREYRLAILDHSKPDHLELDISPVNDVFFSKLKVEMGKSVMIGIKDLRPDSTGNYVYSPQFLYKFV